MTIEVSAKKVDDAIAQGLEQLGASIDDVTVEVLESGGLFRKAKVRLTLETSADKAAEKEPAEEKPKKEPAEEKPKKEQAAEKPKDDIPNKAAEKPAPGKSEKPVADSAAPVKREEKESADKSSDSDSRVKTADKAAPHVKAESADAKAKAKPSADGHKKAEKVSKNEYAPAADMPAVKTSNELSARSTESGPPEAEAKKPQQKHTHTHAKDKAADKQPNAATDTDAASSDGADTDNCTAPDTERSAKRRLRAEDREAAAHALEFVEKTVALMGLTAQVSADEDVEHIDITAPEGDDSLIIGRHGETLSALTYLAETVARAEKCHINLVVDCNGYRARRAASLTAMARRRAHECASKHRRIKLEPMDRVDRRTIHCALSDDEYVSTESEGKEPYRCVVIVPKNGEIADDDRRGNKNRRDRRDRGRKDGVKPAAGEKPRRAAFDVNLHGFVGHNDHSEEPEKPADENSSASAQQPIDDAE